MTNFEKIIEYQDLDIASRKMEKEYERHEDKRKLDQLRGKYNELQNAVNHGEVEAQGLIDDIDAMYKEFKLLMESFSQLSIKIDGAVDDEEKVKLLPQLDAIKSKMESIDRKMSQKIKRSCEVVSVCAKAQESKKQAKANYDTVKLRLDAFKADREPAQKQLNEKMTTLSESIEKEVFDRYTKIRSEGILPVFVPAVGDKNNYSCYCGISLSQAKIGELHEKKMCNCESCRRIVYIK